jgi:hypothetical protein
MQVRKMGDFHVDSRKKKAVPSEQPSQMSARGARERKVSAKADGFDAQLSAVENI